MLLHATRLLTRHAPIGIRLLAAVTLPLLAVTGLGALVVTGERDKAVAMDSFNS